MKQKPLQKGDIIGLITPSSPLMPGRLEAGIAYFEGKGFKVKVGNHNKKTDRYLAGTDEERAEDVMMFFGDPMVKALIATGGGYGSQRILPFLDYSIIRKNPKILVGFSDTTALQLGLLAKAGLVTYTGFTCGDVHDCDIDPFIEETLFFCLESKFYEIHTGTCLKPGLAQGPLIGGNLECLTALIGTPYQPNFKNSILLLEEVRQEPYKIDCMLSQLKLAGIFDQVAGVIFGQFYKCDANYFPDRDGTSQDVINEYVAHLSVPCISGFRYGHGDYRSVLPIGGVVKLDATNCKVSIEF